MPENSIMRSELKVGNVLEEYNYSFNSEDLSGISNFLLHHPGLLKELGNVSNVIPQYFNDFKLKLSLYTDTEEEYQVLNILIQNSLPTEEAFLKERALFKNYFKPTYQKYNGKLNIRETNA